MKLTASFDMDMQSESINAANFTVSGPGGSAIPGVAKLAPDRLSAVFIPASALAIHTAYSAKLTTDVRGLEGNPLEADYAWNFTTGATADAAAPTVLSTVPADGATAVSRGANVTAAFSEAMDPLTVTSTTITLKKGGAAVAGRVTSPLAAAVTFNPTVDLSPGSAYTATITTGVKDAAGNALAVKKTWTFTTRALSALGPSPVDLGLAGNYAILSKAGISTVPTSAVTGNIGVSPAAATYITGFSLILPAAGAAATSAQVIGSVYAPDFAVPTPNILTTAVGNMETAYTDAAGRTPIVAANLNRRLGHLGGRTLEPGLYRWGSGIDISGGDLALAGGDDDVWIFQVGGPITVSAAESIILSGGTLPKNIFWQVQGYVSIGAGSRFAGIVLAATRVDMLTGSSINGRLLSQTAVTLDASTVTQPAP